MAKTKPAKRVAEVAQHRTVIAASAIPDERPGALTVYAGLFWERARPDSDLLGNELYDYKLSGLAVMVRELRLTRKFEGTGVAAQFFNWLRSEAPWLFQTRGRMETKQQIKLYTFEPRRLLSFLRVSAPADFPRDAWVYCEDVAALVTGQDKPDWATVKRILAAHYGYDKDPDYSSLTNFGAVIEVCRQLHLLD